MNGLHLIGDLTGCRCDPQLLLDGESFRAKCLEMVAAAGLTTMDATFHTVRGRRLHGHGRARRVAPRDPHLARAPGADARRLRLQLQRRQLRQGAASCSTSWSSYFQPTEVARARDRPRRAHADGAAQRHRPASTSSAGKQIGEWQTQVPEDADLRHAALRQDLPPRRVQHDLREGGVRLPREPDPPRAHRACGAEEGADHRRRRRRLLRGGAQAPVGRAGDDGRDRRRRDPGREGALPGGAQRRVRQPEAAGAGRRRDEVRARDAREAST